MSTENELNPRSSVMPRSLLCGFLSKAAVDATVLSALPAAACGVKSQAARVAQRWAA
jgi:hypothetical protein